MLTQLMKRLYQDLYHYLIQKNSNIREDYTLYVRDHPKVHKRDSLKRWLLLIKLNFYYRILRVERGYCRNMVSSRNSANIKYYMPDFTRIPIEELCARGDEYDVISFDIFDTALYRTVERPADVFHIMAVEMGVYSFGDDRRNAENTARTIKEQTQFTREVTLDEIYDVLEERYGIDRKWKDREIELEIEVCRQNPYIHQFYETMLEHGKTIIFTSDMYLPHAVLVKMLEKCGYDRFEKLYLSNEYLLRKGDGTLQKVLLEEMGEKKILHIGDNKVGDYEKTIAAGIDAIHNPMAELVRREPDMDSLAGSFYRSIVNNHIAGGMWEQTLHFEHGFRTGGILTTGYCQYINDLAKKRQADKILFCARDCEVIWKAYNRFYKKYDNAYMEMSRLAILCAAGDRYLHDLAGRYILRYFDKFKGSKTIGDVLEECGFAYLIDELEKADIDRYLFPRALDRRKMEAFLYTQAENIREHNKEHIEAAKKYYGDLIGDARRVLVVDIGWSGSCITVFKDFIEASFPERKCEIFGSLMCTSRNRTLTNSMENATLSAYVSSPFVDMDITREIMPGGKAARNSNLQDKLHMPLEYMFTSVASTLLRFGFDQAGNVIFHHSDRPCVNPEEIRQMQEGILAFNQLLCENTAFLRHELKISPYVAFNPLRNSIKNRDYTKAVYGNFAYDAMTPSYSRDTAVARFRELYNYDLTDVANQDGGCIGHILFVTPELVYTGAPRSLLRMCRVALELGYRVTVWSSKVGPFAEEYEKFGIPIRIVPESDLRKADVIRDIKEFDMAVCNTIVTDKYARVCGKYIPTVWYIREATNIPDFVYNNPERLYNLQHSNSLCCVSDYAAEAISKFTKKKIMVVHNCVEDEVDMAVPYVNGSAEKIRFVQFGTMEYRKGYDVLLAAYQAMPEEYRAQAELYFAGGFINSGTPYCDYLFRKMQGEPNVHYLGTVRGEENKIRTLSRMDVVVVASRDESCSLVALEGAMLSKPLIVTENVGAKYLINDKNGYVVKTADVDSLRAAMMQIIDNRGKLVEMGKEARKSYEKLGSMDSYTRDMKKLYAMAEQKNSKRFAMKRFAFRVENSYFTRAFSGKWNHFRNKLLRDKKAEVIVSLTSHPGRIHFVSRCIETLLEQTVKPKKVLLWLSRDQFEEQNCALPEELKALTGNRLFEIRWVEGDMKPHKKYFYAMQEYPELPVIICDDDVRYSPQLVEKLMKSYRKFPDCISSMRVNMMMFRPDGTLRKYDKWIQGYETLCDIPSYALLPTGVGGVLYPPASIRREGFDAEDINETCLFCDDLWLKMHASHNGFRTVLPVDRCKYEDIREGRETALWRLNVNSSNNDATMENLLNYYERKLGSSKDWLEMIQKDRFC